MRSRSKVHELCNSGTIADVSIRSLEELDEIFAAGIPARKFMSYQCHIVEDAVLHTKDAETKASAAHVEEVS